VGSVCHSVKTHQPLRPCLSVIASLSAHRGRLQLGSVPLDKENAYKKWPFFVVVCHWVDVMRGLLKYGYVNIQREALLFVGCRTHM
jgi:hypothetical protein